MVDYEWIDDAAALRAALSSRKGILALDTEADSFHHYGEKLCLVQLSFDGKNYLVDPLADVDFSPLSEPLADPRQPVLLHGADYDLRLLRRCLGLEIRGVFDTMIAARLVGMQAVGLAALLETHLSVRLDKRFQRADWSERPLSEAMRQYAVLDTAHLESLVEILEGKLTELGRTEWAEQEFRHLESREDDTAERPPGWRRMRGAGRLDRRALAVLRELWAVRDDEARRLDLAPFRVLSNDLLLALAQRPPRTVEQLTESGAIPRRWQRADAARRLVEAAERAYALSADELPERERRDRPRRDPEVERRVKRLGAERDRIAEALELDGSVIAPRALLEELIALGAAGRPVSESRLGRPWQLELLAPALRSLAGLFAFGESTDE